MDSHTSKEHIRLFCLTFASYWPITVPLRLEDPFANLCKRHREGEIYSATSLCSISRTESDKSRFDPSMVETWGAEFHKTTAGRHKSDPQPVWIHPATGQRIRLKFLGSQRLKNHLKRLSFSLLMKLIISMHNCILCMWPSNLTILVLIIVFVVLLNSID